MTEAIFFYFFTGFMLIAALSVVLNRQPVYSVLSLLVMMFCLASLFVMLGAYFIAALQVLLYAGAVLVLFLFIIMLLNLAPEALSRVHLFTLRIVGIGAAGLLFAMLARMFLAGSTPTATPAGNSTVESIGRALFHDYVLPFELTSFLILAAIIGAVTLAKQKPSE